MKTARTHKFIALITMFVLSLVCAFCGMNYLSTSADSVQFNASSYFVYSAGNQISSDIRADEDVVKVKLSNLDKVKVQNKLAIDDFEMMVTAPTGAETIVLTLTASAFDVNGNRTEVDGKVSYKKDIANMITVDLVNNTASVNGSSATAVTIANGEIVFGVTVNDNFIDVTVNGTSVSYSKTAEYKLKDNDKVLAVVELNAKLPVDGDPIDLAINYIDQKASATGYKQTFELVDGALKEVAYPIITLNEGFMKTDANGKIIVPVGKENALTINQSLIASGSKTVKLATDDANVWLSNGGNYVVFQTEGLHTIKIVDKEDETIVYETYEIDAKAELADGDGEAPVYNGDAAALESFKNEIQERLVDAYDEDGNPIFVRLGSTEYLEVPSLKNLISDNVSAYEDLTFTLYYQTPTGEQSTTGLRIPLATAGKYTFYILAKDELGNGMTTDKFFSTDANGEKEFDGEYAANYKFEFTILDNAPIIVTPATSQGNGYIGVTYAATGFTIKASSYEVKYQLFFTEDDSAIKTGWVEIPAASNVTDIEYDKDGFTYEDIQNINYDGNLSFKPDRKGYYKIVCTVTSTTSSRVTETAETTIISIQEKPQVVVAKENDWLANNVWSVVFLSVGTVCLIAIIVLLCIKPKENVAPAGTPARTKTRSKRNK